MDTEKIKQMGRDYFTANPDKINVAMADPKMSAFIQTLNKADRIEDYLRAWSQGHAEARYAASKEGRAIELLGLLFMTDMNGDPDAVEVEAKVSAFLQEIGQKPQP